MKGNFLSKLFNGKAAEPAAETELPAKHFAVVHAGQGRMQVKVEDTHEKLAAFLYEYCGQTPTDIEAMGTCDKNGVLEMTNPDKFPRDWLNRAIQSQMSSMRGWFRKPNGPEKSS